MHDEKPGAYRKNERGFTVIEMGVVVVVFCILLLAILGTLCDSFGIFTLGEDMVALQEQSRAAINFMCAELREAGIQPNPTGPDPYPTITGGNTIQFISPADQDADGFLTKGPPASSLYNIGDVEWDLANVIQYRVEQAPSGEGMLVRRVNGANPRVFARYVQSVQLDDFDTDPVNVALGEVRVQLNMVKNTVKQNTLTYNTSFSVAMRN